MLISSRKLNTTDPDTLPSEIIYAIEDKANIGDLYLKSNLDTPISTFSQQDINNDQVIFNHNGGRESGAFFFRVSDGRFEPYYKVFKITIHPLTLQVVNESALSILQGNPSTILTSDVFKIKTNGNRSAIMYNITIPPIFGQLFIDNAPVSFFSQQSIDNSKYNI